MTISQPDSWVSNLRLCFRGFPADPGDQISNKGDNHRAMMINSAGLHASCWLLPHSRLGPFSRYRKIKLSSIRRTPQSEFLGIRQYSLPFVEALTLHLALFIVHSNRVLEMCHCPCFSCEVSRTQVPKVRSAQRRLNHAHLPTAKPASPCWCRKGGVVQSLRSLGTAGHRRRHAFPRLPRQACRPAMES